MLNLQTFSSCIIFRSMNKSLLITNTIYGQSRQKKIQLSNCVKEIFLFSLMLTLANFSSLRVSASIQSVTARNSWGKVYEPKGLQGLQFISSRILVRVLISVKRHITWNVCNKKFINKQMTERSHLSLKTSLIVGIVSQMGPTVSLFW